MSNSLPFRLSFRFNLILPFETSSFTSESYLVPTKDFPAYFYESGSNFHYGQGRFITDMNAPILRFADILLINAEAANELGMEAEALTSLNRVLKRARDFGVSLDASAYGAAPVDVLLGNTKEDLREIIFWERAKELAFEGHSKLDLIRATV